MNPKDIKIDRRCVSLDKTYIKPPIGIVPKLVHDRNRIQEILDAMKRYNEVNKTIPAEWFQELEAFIDA